MSVYRILKMQNRASEIKILSKKIKEKSAVVGIIGLGYVGLPLAIAFSEKFKVIGFDISQKKIEMLLTGRSYIKDVGDIEIQRCLNSTFIPTSNNNMLYDCDFLIICVPTPLTEEKKPDLSYIKSACENICKILKKGHFVILESTTYPGTTENILVPFLEKNGLKAGIDFGVAYSPERIDPGNKKYTIKNTPKVVGGINKECTDIAAELYGSIIDVIIKVENCKTAEAVKLIENIFRNINIAMINELALIFEKIGIDIWEAISAAATKPFGFMPFYPGPGVGGHCIPIDPFYLSYEAKKRGFIPRFIELGSEINEFMIIHTLNLAEKGLSNVNKSISNSIIAVIGLAYKKNIDDVRESPSKKIIEEIINRGGEVKVYDPYVNSITTKFGEFVSEKNILDALRDVDCAIFVVDHEEFKNVEVKEMKKIMKHPIIIDCKNLFDKYKIKNHKIYLYGIGKPH